MPNDPTFLVFGWIILTILFGLFTVLRFSFTARSRIIRSTSKFGGFSGSRQSVLILSALSIALVSAPLTLFISSVTYFFSIDGVEISLFTPISIATFFLGYFVFFSQER